MTAIAQRFIKVGAKQQNDVDQFPIFRDERTGLMWDRRETKRMNFADAEKHVAKLNEQKFGGFDDWQLPELHQLESIRDITQYDPAIDKNAFPDCQAAAYWTCSDYAVSRSVCAWIVGFDGGLTYFSLRYDTAFVRACRPSQ